jgi:transposase-like protein
VARRRYTRDEKAEFLKTFGRSDGNAASFCRKHRVAYHTFLGWRRGAGRKPGSAAAALPAHPRFVELEVERGERVGPRPAAGPAVELVLGGGMVLRIFAPQPERRP